ncbi:DUF4129 domain-containing protein [Neobacillus sp. SAB-20_R2A]|uniref:DUF4129 domain-containing protein n=1 Tax=Neobacillus sp. SAB-20_R2A TaxID=3120519 RepID=UPI003C6E6484
MLTTEKARENLEKILNEKEYRVYDKASKGLFAEWWEKTKQWIADKLAGLFPSIESADNAASSILIAVIIVVIVLLALAVFFLIRHYKRERVLRSKKPLQSLKDINWTYHEHLKEAEKLETAADYSAATRHLFLALLLFFHDKGWLEARKWKTNWEYYEELRKENKQQAGQFYHLAYFFDEVTYGEREAFQEEYRQFQSVVLSLLSEMNKEGGGNVAQG